MGTCLTKRGEPVVLFYRNGQRDFTQAVRDTLIHVIFGLKRAEQVDGHRSELLASVDDFQYLTNLMFDGVKCNNLNEKSSA